MMNEGADHLFSLNTEETSQSRRLVTKHILGRHHPRPHPGLLLRQPQLHSSVLFKLRSALLLYNDYGKYKF